MKMLDEFYTVKDKELEEILEAFKVFDIKNKG